MYQKYFVKLTSEERQYLERLISSGIAPARKLQRARILLKSDCSEGGPNWTYEAICDAFDVNSMTVTTQPGWECGSAPDCNGLRSCTGWV